jgi:hypothetical protein
MNEVVNWPIPQWFLRDSWLYHTTGGELQTQPRSVLKLSELERSEWSTEFETLMRNRLLMGALRYGRLGREGKRKFNRVEDVIRRLMSYEETGNLEHLVDSANLLMAEFVEGDHPLRHWVSVDDGEHTSIKEK